MRILYLHPAAAFGGASKSLLELFGVLKKSGITATVLAPAGSASSAFAKAGMEVRNVRGLSQLDNTRYGYYRKLRWLILLRELFLLPGSLAALWRLRTEHFDLIHVNEITLLPLAMIAKRWLGKPMVVHVRSLQREPGTGWRTRLVNGWLRRHADAVIAIDQTVAASLEDNLPLHVVHNGLAVDIASLPRREAAGDIVRIGFLGVLVPLKGVYELVEAMRILKERAVPAECWIVGENARELSGLKAWVLKRLGFGRNVRAELQALIARHSLEGQVRLLGFVSDIQAIYSKIDILCFPSHLDTAGRPVFESAFFSIPSVVAVANPLSDAVIHEVTGLAVPAPEPALIADALERLIADAGLRLRLGEQARDWADANFSIGHNGALVLEVYERVISLPTVSPGI